jgi:hypothetical protein
MAKDIYLACVFMSLRIPQTIVWRILTIAPSEIRINGGANNPGTEIVLLRRS